MKKSNYYKIMMCLAFLSAVTSVLSLYFRLGSTAAVFISITFIFWFAAVMAPDSEKYKYMKK